MLNTNCERCLFAKPGTDGNLGECSQNIIKSIKNLKVITQENNYNVIQEYACRYGFSKDTYDAYQNHLKDLDLMEHINKNAQCRYYLIIDINMTNNLQKIIEIINGMHIKPSFVSFMFRDTSIKFTEQDKQELTTSAKFEWKAHNFVHNMDLQEGIDHILSTNMQNNHGSHFLVYNSLDIDQLIPDITVIHNNLILYQIPHIAMIRDKNFTTLYGLFMAFDNYKVAKSIGPSLLDILKNESQILII